MKKAILVCLLMAVLAAGSLPTAYGSERAQIDRLARKQLKQQQILDQKILKLQQEAAKAIAELRHQKQK